MTDVYDGDNRTRAKKGRVGGGRLLEIGKVGIGVRIGEVVDASCSGGREFGMVVWVRVAE